MTQQELQLAEETARACHADPLAGDLLQLVMHARRLEAELRRIADLTWPLGHAISAAQQMQQIAQTALPT